MHHLGNVVATMKLRYPSIHWTSCMIDHFSYSIALHTVFFHVFVTIHRSWILYQPHVWRHLISVLEFLNTRQSWSSWCHNSAGNHPASHVWRRNLGQLHISRRFWFSTNYACSCSIWKTRSAWISMTPLHLTARGRLNLLMNNFGRLLRCLVNITWSARSNASRSDFVHLIILNL